jgi:gamma-D-glutamyl-L-lysine dipeptidyl-peptidase
MTDSLANKDLTGGLAGVCRMAVIPIRKEPSEESEMISQVLFGERFRVEETLDKWLKVITVFDHYKGWIDRKFFQETDLEKEMEGRMQPVLHSRIAEVETRDGSLQLIPAGSSLPLYDHSTNSFMIGKERFRIRPVLGDILLPASQRIFETAQLFINTPYLWGGRSVFGFDCSGFVQTVFKIHGVALPRETSLQVLEGQEIFSLNNTVPGDLAFFRNEEGMVNHVGMVLADSRIIHCSGWVRIDRLDEKGIFNRQRGMYTHQLMGVRRVFPGA